MKKLSLGDLVMCLGLVIIVAGFAMMHFPIAVCILGAGIGILGQRLG